MMDSSTEARVVIVRKMADTLLSLVYGFLEDEGFQKRISRLRADKSLPAEVQDSFAVGAKMDKSDFANLTIRGCFKISYIDDRDAFKESVSATAATIATLISAKLIKQANLSKSAKYLDRKIQRTFLARVSNIVQSMPDREVIRLGEVVEVEA